MAILQQCPICRAKQKVSNKRCRCGHDLDKAKRSRLVKYYVKWSYMKNGELKQSIKLVGTSIDEAKASDGKRKAQKKENPKILEIAADNKTKFADLAGWYTNLQKVKKLTTRERVRICLNNFNKVFGDNLISDLTVPALNDYVEKRRADSMADSSINVELTIAKQMIKNAFYADKISGDALKVFARLDTVFERGSNARTVTISFQDYLKLLGAAPDYLKSVIIVAMNTGMRIESEILRLKWTQIDRKTGFIRFKKEDTKERKVKVIPINHNVAQVLDSIMSHVHHPFVFTCQHRPIKKLTSFKVCCRKAGLPYGYKTECGIVARDIRRTVKTNMVEAGVQEIYRDILLGHRKHGMDVHYIQPDEARLAAALEKYTTWLDNEIENCKLQFCDQTSDHGK
jgi:integrase